MAQQCSPVKVQTLLHGLQGPVWSGACLPLQPHLFYSPCRWQHSYLTKQLLSISRLWHMLPLLPKTSSFFLLHHLANSFSFFEPRLIQPLLLGASLGWRFLFWVPTTLGCLFVTELITLTSIYLVTFQTPALDWELLEDRNYVFFVLVWHFIYGCLINVCRMNVEMAWYLIHSKPMFIGLNCYPGKKQ